MTFLNNVNISKKLTIGFAIVVTVVAVMCAAVFASLMSIKSAVALNDQSVAQLELAQIARDQIWAILGRNHFNRHSRLLLG